MQGMQGKTIEDVLIRREGLRYPFPDDLATLAGTTVADIRRRAKYLLIDLDDGRVLLSHLGMSGRYTLFDSDEASAAKPLLQTVNGGVPVSSFGDATGHGGKHDHLEFIFTDGSRAVYTDPRRFGIIDLFPSEAEAEHKLLASLGPEPFDPWDARALAKRLRGRKTAIKLALLDQKVVVGVGNIYVCESLHRAGISPRREAGGLVRKRSAHRTSGRPCQPHQGRHQRSHRGRWVHAERFCERGRNAGLFRPSVCGLRSRGAAL